MSNTLKSLTPLLLTEYATLAEPSRPDELEGLNLEFKYQLEYEYYIKLIHLIIDFF